MAEQWVKSNYNIVDGPDGDAIDWGTGAYTSVSMFLSMFGIVIQSAIDNGTDPRQAIIDADDGRGFADLV